MGDASRWSLECWLSPLEWRLAHESGGASKLDVLSIWIGEGVFLTVAGAGCSTCLPLSSFSAMALDLLSKPENILPKLLPSSNPMSWSNCGGVTVASVEVVVALALPLLYCTGTGGVMGMSSSPAGTLGNCFLGPPKDQDRPADFKKLEELDFEACCGVWASRLLANFQSSCALKSADDGAVDALL